MTSTALTKPEQKELEQLEAVIEKGMETFVEVGFALMTIREKRLYREVYLSFEEYCHARWDVGRRRANQLIAAAGVFQNLLPPMEEYGNHGSHTETSEVAIPLPINERQARPLADLEPDEQRESWKESVATSRNGVPTSDEVKETVQRRKTGVHEGTAARGRADERLARQQRPPEPDAEPDDLDIPIQKHARKAFEARPLFDELLAKLKECRKLYAALAEHPGGAYLLRPGISINARESWKHKGIETAILNVADCRPSMTVCPRAYHLEAFPDCKDRTPHGEDCTLCHGINWSRPLGKNEVAPEVIEKVKEKLGV